MKHTLKIKSIFPVTHNVRCYRLEKPEGYAYIPGQATDVAVNKPGWQKKKRPFTFTALNSAAYLEFTIKSYTDHDGVTQQIGRLAEGDELLLEDPWGAIAYNGEGIFIAGGAGITPFMAILRQLANDGRMGNNRLFFSNKTAADIIYKEELQSILGENVTFLLSQEAGTAHHHGRIDEAFLQQQVDNFRDKHFYVCGPDAMVQGISDILVKNGADPQTVIFEK